MLPVELQGSPMTYNIQLHLVMSVSAACMGSSEFAWRVWNVITGGRMQGERKTFSGRYLVRQSIFLPLSQEFGAYSILVHAVYCRLLFSIHLMKMKRSGKWSNLFHKWALSLPLHVVYFSVVYKQQVLNTCLKARSAVLEWSPSRWQPHSGALWVCRCYHETRVILWQIISVCPRVSTVKPWLLPMSNC